MTVAVLAPGLFLGCNTADNPKIPEVAPANITPDKEVPKTGETKAPYGAAKKYQDMMPK